MVEHTKPKSPIAMRTQASKFIQRFPFTIALLLVTVAVGWGTDSHWRPLRPSLLEQFGFAPRHALRGEMIRLATSVFITHGEKFFLLTLGMIAVAVGFAERRVGTAKAILSFFGIHLATLLVQSLLLGIVWPRLDVWWVHLLATENDVGPSAGYYGCLGVVCHKQPQQRRTWLLSVIGGLLLARVVWSGLSPYGDRADLSAAVAHLIAFPLGVSLGKRF